MMCHNLLCGQANSEFDQTRTEYLCGLVKSEHV